MKSGVGVECCAVFCEEQPIFNLKGQKFFKCCLSFVNEDTVPKQNTRAFTHLMFMFDSLIVNN